MAEDLGEEDVVGLVFWFELVAADGSVGASQVAWFPGFVQRAEGGAVGSNGTKKAVKRGSCSGRSSPRATASGTANE